MLNTSVEIRTSSLSAFRYGLLHMDTLMLSDQQNIYQLCTDPGCHLEDLLRTMTNRDGWRESQGNLCCRHALMMMMMIAAISEIDKFIVSLEN